MAQKKNTAAVAAKPAAARKPRKRTLGILRDDPWLEPFAAAIEGRHEDAKRREKELTGGRRGGLDQFANAHNYFGLHRTADGGWVFREWAPHATGISLIGDFNGWKAGVPEYTLHPVGNGNWEVEMPFEAMRHGQLYKMYVSWDGGSGERIPAYATRVVQDEKTHLFSAQVWAPAEPYNWKVSNFEPDTRPLLIYECHIGMAQDKEGVGTYAEFRDNILPRIAAGLERSVICYATLNRSLVAISQRPQQCP